MAGEGLAIIARGSETDTVSSIIPIEPEARSTGKKNRMSAAGPHSLGSSKTGRCMGREPTLKLSMARCSAESSGTARETWAWSAASTRTTRDRCTTKCR